MLKNTATEDSSSASMVSLRRFMTHHHQQKQQQRKQQQAQQQQQQQQQCAQQKGARLRWPAGWLSNSASSSPGGPQQQQLDRRGKKKQGRGKGVRFYERVRVILVPSKEEVDAERVWWSNQELSAFQTKWVQSLSYAMSAATETPSEHGVATPRLTNLSSPPCCCCDSSGLDSSVASPHFRPAKAPGCSSDGDCCDLPPTGSAAFWQWTASGGRTSRGRAMASVGLQSETACMSDDVVTPLSTPSPLPVLNLPYAD